MQELIKKAGILIEALPYIQEFYGKTVVIKYGGNAMISEELKNKVMEDITLLKYIGLHPVLVHGGGPDISKALTRFGIQSEFVNGLRVTDEETMSVAQMVLIGKTNKEIVSLLNTKGGKAVGISGIDAGLINCEKQFTEVDGKSIDIGYVGKIKNIDKSLIEFLSNDDYIPVIAPIGVDDNGNSYNINADTVAGAVASALKAEKLMLLTDTPGIKSSPDADDIIVEINRKEIYNMIEKGTIAGGMIPKVKGALEALDGGVNNVHIIDGRVPHCLLLEIFTDHGVGTMISQE